MNTGRFWIWLSELDAIAATMDVDIFRGWKGTGVVWREREV